MLVADSIKYVYSIALFTSKMITGTVCVGYPAALPWPPQTFGGEFSN